MHHSGDRERWRAAIVVSIRGLSQPPELLSDAALRHQHRQAPRAGRTDKLSRLTKVIAIMHQRSTGSTTKNPPPFCHQYSLATAYESAGTGQSGQEGIWERSRIVFQHKWKPPEGQAEGASVLAQRAIDKNTNTRTPSSARDGRFSFLNSKGRVRQCVHLPTVPCLTQHN